MHVDFILYGAGVEAQRADFTFVAVDLVLYGAELRAQRSGQLGAELICLTYQRGIVVAVCD